MLPYFLVLVICFVFFVLGFASDCLVITQDVPEV